ncbi:MAG: Stk1 family PASTA domain-containing Ser/Thr kinase [Oscillospiraceae bacterium]|nr:Stk1 family PASTA domain-containing Ser/Thr kinase [Oscillospiraceae bacterium]
MDIDRYIGRLLDNRYEILEVIGTGGMAVVYKARCHRLNRLVAIKILKDEFTADEEFRRRFRAEGEAVAMLSHPNIVSVYDVSSSDDANFIVMELIEGITLKQYMEKKGILNWKETLHFGMQIAKALEHAHDKGIVHRDIKPHNVMVLKNGSVKVTDFGIARVMSKSNTLTKEALGSVHYISPEQAKGGWVDNRSDLYSLSVVMYEMMAGRPPYDGESPVAVAIQHINGGAVMPSTLNPNIPGGLEQIIMKGMALDPQNRYASATEMLKDMDEFRKDPSMLFVMPGMPTGATQVLPSKDAIKAETAKNIAKTTAAAAAAAAAKPRSTEVPKTQKNPGTSRPRSAGEAAASAETARRAAAAERARKEQEAREAEKRSRTTTVAIVACSAVAIIAIICFLVALSNGMLFRNQALVPVPKLEGKVYEDLPAYDTFIVEIADTQHSEDFAKGVIMEQKIPEGTKVEVGTVVKVIVSAGPKPKEDEPILMEDLIVGGGVTFEYAKSYLETLGFRVLPFEETNEEFEEGRVFKTDPEAGTELKEGQTIKIWVSTGSAIETAKMPGVVGMQYDDAYKTLIDCGFKTITYKPVESDAEKDEVIEQPFAEDEEVDIHEEIKLTISTGPKPTDPPTEEPTQKPTEEPTDPEITMVFTFKLPADRTEDYMLSLRQNGVEHLEPTLITAGTPSIEVLLTGSGVQYYELYINDEYYSTEKVEFLVYG